MEYKGLFSNLETRDTYEFLTAAGPFVNRQLTHCKSPKEVRLVCIDWWPQVATEFLNKINFDEIFELMVR